LEPESLKWSLLDVDDTKEYLGICGHAGCIAMKNERKFYSVYLEDFSSKNKVLEKPGDREFVRTKECKKLMAFSGRKSNIPMKAFSCSEAKTKTGKLLGT
jgi:hypothetical protein